MLLAAKNSLCCSHCSGCSHVLWWWCILICCLCLAVCLFFSAPSFSTEFVTLSCLTHSCCLRWHSAGTKLQQHKQETMWQWICCKSSATTGSAAHPVPLSVSVVCLSSVTHHTHPSSHTLTHTQRHPPTPQISTIYIVLTFFSSLVVTVVEVVVLSLSLLSVSLSVTHTHTCTHFIHSHMHCMTETQYTA